MLIRSWSGVNMVVREGQPVVRPGCRAVVWSQDPNFYLNGTAPRLEGHTRPS
jgi:hypothetical protein